MYSPLHGNYPLDLFGYGEYAVILYANQRQINTLNVHRKRIELNRATYDAHVTVKGTFRLHTHLNQIKSCLHKVAKQQNSFYIEFASDQLYSNGSGVELRVKKSQHLFVLHTKVEKMLYGLTADEYQREHPSFIPHLTISYGIQNDKQLKSAISEAKKLSFGRGFLTQGMDLVARIGPAIGGKVENIEHYPFKPILNKATLQ